MLQTPTPFPATGAMCFRAHTAEPARILRHNGAVGADGGTVLLQRLQQLSDGTLLPIPGASGNTTVPLAEVFEDAIVAKFGSKSAATRARRAFAVGGR